MDWVNEIQISSVNEYWDKIINILTNFRDKSIPQFKRRSENDVPWLNNKLKVLIKKRNNLFKRYKKMANLTVRLNILLPEIM